MPILTRADKVDKVVDLFEQLDSFKVRYWLVIFLLIFTAYFGAVIFDIINR
jgi:hypothetical protein